MAEYTEYISGHMNAMQSLFGEADYIKCPLDCEEHFVREDYLDGMPEVTTHMHPPKIRINMFYHLSMMLIGREWDFDDYNFHFF